MVLEFIMNAIKSLLFLILKVLPNLPSLGEDFDVAIEYFNSMLSTASSLINLFIPWKLVVFGLPLVIAVSSFEHIYVGLMWVLRKIPMLGID